MYTLMSQEKNLFSHLHINAETEFLKIVIVKEVLQTLSWGLKKTIMALRNNILAIRIIDLL